MDPIAARVAMINGWFDLPASTVDGMKEIRVAVEECAKKIKDVFEREGKDTGRGIATIDLLQQAKNTACDALILPYAK